MTLADYRTIQWYMNFLFWVLELTMIIQLLLARKAFSKFMFGLFLIAMLDSFIDTNLVLLKVFNNDSINRILFVFNAFVSQYWFHLALFYFVIFKKKFAKLFLSILIFHFVLAIIFIVSNYINGLRITTYLMALNSFFILPLSLFSIFQFREEDIAFKWYLSPEYLFSSAIFIEFFGNAVLNISGSFLLKNYEEILYIVLTFHLFTWVVFCLMFIYGLRIMRKKQ